MVGIWELIRAQFHAPISPISNPVHHAFFFPELGLFIPQNENAIKYLLLKTPAFNSFAIQSFMKIPVKISLKNCYT